MIIKGFTKTTLLDYPGHIASTVFTGGCNFNCPFCHNGDLVLGHMDLETLPTEKVLAHVYKRRNVVKSICISGGEPTLQGDLIAFLEEVKRYGILVKLDTNGTHPEVIKKAYEKGLIDYIAMDIKNRKDKYNETCDRQVAMDKIQKSIDYIKSCGVDYEFRTTIIKELHTYDDILQIGQWLSGSRRYFLQSYMESDKQIQGGLHAHEIHTLKEFRVALEPYFDTVTIRGVDVDD